MNKPSLFSPPKEKRLFVILGAFGSGKTEFAVNLALQLAGEGRKTALADLDLVNPYFRSREKEDLLTQHGIDLIAPRGALRDADLPSIPPSLRGMLFDTAVSGILDVGGDKVGARVLGQFTQEILSQDPEVYYIYNQARFENRFAEQAIFSLRQIEAQAGLTITGLINNTHLMGDTVELTLNRGAKGAQALSELTGLPVVCHCVQKSLRDTLPLSPLFVMDLFMNRPWEEA